MHPALGHEIEHAVDIAFDAHLAPVPAVARYDALQVLDMQPVLDVDAQRRGRVRSRHAGCRRPMMRAGMPPTITSSSVTSLVTTAPAATITPLAMRVPGSPNDAVGAEPHVVADHDVGLAALLPHHRTALGAAVVRREEADARTHQDVATEHHLRALARPDAAIVVDVRVAPEMDVFGIADRGGRMDADPLFGLDPAPPRDLLVDVVGEAVGERCDEPRRHSRGSPPRLACERRPARPVLRPARSRSSPRHDKD